MMMPSNDESCQTAYFAAQLENLSLRAAKSGIVLYSDFLTLPQRTLAVHAAKHAGCSICLFGGIDDSQRKVAAFAKDAGDLEKTDFPIVILKAEYDVRFLDGALMSLSVRRKMIGDIVIGEAEAYLFVH